MNEVPNRDDYDALLVMSRMASVTVTCRLLNLANRTEPPLSISEQAELRDLREFMSLKESLFGDGDAASNPR